VDNCPGVNDELFHAIAKHNHVIHTLLATESWGDGGGKLGGRCKITQVTDEGIEAILLARKDGLKQISLPEGTTDRSIQLVVEHCPTVECLELFSSRITDEGCQPIMKLRRIRKLLIGDDVKGNCFPSLRLIIN